MATTLSSETLVNGQDIFSTSATAYTSVGAMGTTGDGRKFRFCLAGGTTLVPGKLQQASAQDGTNYQNLAVAAAAIGATTISVTSSVTVAANVFSGGYVMVSVTPGQGYMYQVGGNTAATAGTFTITLNDPIKVALTTSSKIDVLPNPFSGVVVNPATASSAPVGVAVYPVTNAQYGWIQVSGVTNLLADGAVTVGTSLVASNATAGAVEPLTGVQAVVGIAVTDISTTEYGSVQVFLD